MQVLSRVTLSAAALLVAAVAGTSARHADAPLVDPADAAGYTTQQLPDGAGKEVVTRLCAGCHDLMFTVSTRETEDGWTRIVNDMRSKGADGSEEDFAKVIAYLATYMGKPGPAPTAR